MNLLLFTDLHGDLTALESLKNKSRSADMILCSGDVSQMENNIHTILKSLNTFGKTVLIIHGNHEDELRLKDLCKNYDKLIYLHKAVHHFGPYVFLGYGGDGFSKTDPEFDRVAEKFFSTEVKGKDKVILMTHGPPYGTLIDKIDEVHRGNQSYRTFIDKIRPHIVVSGHLHENAGKYQKVDRTLFINPGKQGKLINI